MTPNYAVRSPFIEGFDPSEGLIYIHIHPDSIFRQN